MRYIAHSAQRAHILLIIIIIRGILRFVFGYYYFIYFVFLPYIGWYGISWPLCACWLSKITMHSCGYTSTQPELSHDAISFDGSECVCWRGFNKFAYAHPMLCMNARTTHTHTDERSHSLWAIWIFGIKYSSLLNKFCAFVSLNKTSRRMSKFHRPKQLAVLRECVCVSVFFFRRFSSARCFPPVSIYVYIGLHYSYITPWAVLFASSCFQAYTIFHKMRIFFLARRSFSVNFSAVRVCVLTCWYF